jgi:predicted ATPase with chaperone activity
VQAAKELQLERFELTQMSANSEMSSKDVKNICILDSEGE